MAFSVLNEVDSSSKVKDDPFRLDIFWAIVTLILVVMPRCISYQGSEAFSDSDQYVAFVDYFRGARVGALVAPYSFRPLVPYVASLLPFSALTALKLVNVVSLAIALYFLAKTLALLEVSRAVARCGMFLWIVSFPVFYYGAIGIVDPGLIASLTVCLFLLFSQRWIWVSLMIFVGVLIKEQMVLIFPAVFVYLLLNEKKSLVVTYSFLYILSFVAGSKCAKLFAPTIGPFFWNPSVSVLFDNLSRVRFWESCLLSMTIIPAAIFLLPLEMRDSYSLKDRTVVYALGAGIVSAVGIFSFSLVAAYPDGRFIWLSYPFLVPLLCYCVRGGALR